MDEDKPYLSVTDPLYSLRKQAELLSTRINLFPENIIGPTIQSSLTKFTESFNALKIPETLSLVAQPKVDFPALDIAHSSSLLIANMMKTDQVSLITESISKSDWINQISDFSNHVLKIQEPFKDLLLVTASKQYQIDLGISKLYELKIDNPLVNNFAIQTTLSKISELTIHAEKSLLHIGLENIGSKLELVEPLRLQVAGSFIDLSNSYNNLFKSFEANPASITQINPFLLKDIPASYFNSANLLEVISVEEDEEIEEEELKADIYYESESNIYSLLNDLNPELKQLWSGANAAINSNTPDKVRHFATSVRELFTHVIHTLAPDKKIENWNKKSKLYHNGRPTRKARLLYICREINHSSMTDFINDDVKSILTFVDLFNEQTHKIKSDLTPKQLITLKTKAETTLKYLIEVGIK
jgi:hypothetical protein